MATSQNGYKANDRSVIVTRTIEGTNVRVSLREGSPGDLLAHWAAWFHKNIQPIDKGQADDWGFAERNIRGSSTTLSNHASGTALDLNATQHPLGKTGTFNPSQYRKIRAELAKYEGTIRWGGDYHGRKDEMHFEIMASPARCAQVLWKLEHAASPPPRVTAPVNHVTKAHELLAEAVVELRKTKKSRTGVHSLADDIEARVNRKGTPKS